MVGNLFLLLAMSTYARFIIREIKGLNRKSGQKKRRAVPQTTEIAARPAPPRSSPVAASAPAKTAPPLAKKVVVPPSFAQKPQAPPQPTGQNKTAKDQRGSQGYRKAA
jgi:hypothetical protein